MEIQGLANAVDGVGRVKDSTLTWKGCRGVLRQATAYCWPTAACCCYLWLAGRGRGQCRRTRARATACGGTAAHHRVQEQSATYAPWLVRG
jgi:hypothetical protein